MFTRPVDLDEAAVVDCLLEAWGIAADSIQYRPLGFGSHHWVAQGESRRWFLSVDDLNTRLLDVDDDRATAFTRLNAALSTARALHDSGCHWVVAPERSAAGRVVEAINERFVCAVYPFIDGRTSSSGRYGDIDERRAVVAVLAELHRSHRSVDVAAMVDDHRIPRRDSLEDALRDVDRRWSSGPYADSARLLLAQHRHAVAVVLNRYDELSDAIRRRASPVITHGEPHRGNVIITADGPAVIDWDTTRLAPAERDLWSLVEEDETVREVYEQQSGTSLDDDALTLYRLWWDLCEIALYTHDFRQSHTHTDDTVTAWKGLATHLDPSRWTDILNSTGRS